MQPARFDQMTQFFASRRISRRRALAAGGVGIAAGMLAAGLPTMAGAQDATPNAMTADAGHGPEMFFLSTMPLCHRRNISSPAARDDQHQLSL